ncbi:hypothetical protein BGU93_19325 [Clostridioides difficile]|nr:hypothetical protein BGU93_19325 [Clostridioides difficile]
MPDLTQNHEKHIDGISEPGAKWETEEGFPEIAEDLQKPRGRRKGIADTIEPTTRHSSLVGDRALYFSVLGV